MYRSRVVVLLTVFSFFQSFAQDPSGAPPMTDEDRAARRAQFMQMLQGRMNGGGGGAPIDQAVSTQQPPIGDLLATTQQPAQTGSDVTVNWENVTLKDCIEVLCRDLGMEFVISPSVNVSQEVSVRAGDVTKWTIADKQELFDAILETAGVQRVQRGRVWVFSPSDIRPVVDSFQEQKYGDGKPVIGVIKLKDIDASQAESFLNTVGGKPPRVFAMKGSRMILVLGTQQFLTQMEALVKLIDLPPGVMRSYVLENASSDDMAKELGSIFYNRTGGNGEAIRFTSVPRLNVVVAVNVPDGVIDEVSQWVKLLDRADDENERVTRVYRLQVVQADTIGKTLDSLYSTLYKLTQAENKQMSVSSTGTKKASGSTGNAAKPNASASSAKGNGAAAAPKAAAPAAKSSPDASGSPDMEEEAVILFDKDTNTLIVNATPDQHRDIEKTLKELDRPRRQVLIETVLVEMTLSEGTDLGVEWATSKGLSTAGLESGIKSVSSSGINTLGSTTTDSGLSYLLQSSSEKWAFIQAAENDNRLQVLASPTVLTRDGMEATVSFGKEVPVIQNSVTDSGKQNFSYDYHDAKMTLTVTPTIDDNKNVTLALAQTQRQVDTSTSSSNAPTFTTREINSSLQVADGQTLILGGLIQRNDQTIRSGIPLLSRLPYLGWLFGRNQTSKIGTEILMILTPHVVDTREETDQLTKEFRTKILGAMSTKDVHRLYSVDETNLPPVVTEGEIPAEEKGN